MGLLDSIQTYIGLGVLGVVGYVVYKNWDAIHDVWCKIPGIECDGSVANPIPGGPPLNVKGTDAWCQCVLGSKDWLWYPYGDFGGCIHGWTGEKVSPWDPTGACDALR